MSCIVHIWFCALASGQWEDKKKSLRTTDLTGPELQCVVRGGGECCLGVGGVGSGHGPAELQSPTDSGKASHNLQLDGTRTSPW